MTVTDKLAVFINWGVALSEHSSGNHIDRQTTSLRFSRRLLEGMFCMYVSMYCNWLHVARACTPTLDIQSTQQAQFKLLVHQELPRLVDLILVHIVHAMGVVV